jgi:hypothetical protein
VSPEIQAAVRNLSESVKNLGILSRFAEEKASTSGSSSRKRKKMHEVFKSSDATRDTRMVTRVNSTNVLDEGLRIGEVGRQMNSSG